MTVIFTNILMHMLNILKYIDAHAYVLWFKFIFGLKLFEPVSFLFPFVQIMIMNIRQRIIKIKLTRKILNRG